MSVGVVYIRVRLQLEMDIDETDVKDFVNGLDYSVSGGTVEGVNLVADTEITDFDSVADTEITDFDS